MTNFSRRSFLKQAALSTGYLLVGINTFSRKLIKITPADLKTTDFNAFVKITPDGNIVAVVSRSEMGQGIRTSMAAIIADELEADLNKVIIEQGLGDPKFGDQNTDGSKSIRNLFNTMREAGAAVKTLLLAAAAKKWNLPESECFARENFVYNKRGKKSFSYGELAELASTLPLPAKIKLKARKDFKYIGKEYKNKDLNDIVTGKAVYGIDASVPGMVYAAIKRCPVRDGRVVSFEPQKALAFKGVKKVVEIKATDSAFSPFNGVAVIAENTWAAFKARDLLEVNWDYGKNSSYNSEQFVKQMSEAVRQKGEVVKSAGNIEKAFAAAGIVNESVFTLPHLAHATMEPPNAVAIVKKSSCEIWAPTQDPQTAQNEAAKFLGLKPEAVKVHVTFLGGGFGRKSIPDYVLEAVALSRDLKVPVKVVWSREDDIKHDFYHTVSAQYLKAALDKNGNITAWQHRVAFPSIASTFDRAAVKPADFELSQGVTNLPYLIENISCETAAAEAHVRIGWYRSVCNIFHSYAVNVFLNELAAKAGKDPVEFRLGLIGPDRLVKNGNSKIMLDTARYKKVLKQAAKNAGWGRKMPKGKGMGIALHYSFYSYVAQVVEVAVKGGQIKVEKVHCVIDCGTVANKDAVKNQLEGAIIFGLSLANYGKITAKNGIIEQSSFDNYPLLRMPEAPEIHVEIIENDQEPTGVGEPGVPPLAPALASAIYAATGKWHYSLPLSGEG
jgi:isoquinoline 1-oxidoreductase beta subunit